MVDHALAYAGLGWHVFPCYPMRGGICGCGRPQCTSPGKHPATVNGLTDASTNPDAIRDMWAQIPDASIGVVMEPSGLCALDLDDYKEESDLARLAVLEQQLGPLPSTVTQRSGSGRGFHAVFKSPGFPVRGVIGGIVVRAKAYIIASPSNHASGGSYAWQEGLGPTEIEIAEFPAAWKAALERTKDLGSAGVPAEEPDWLASIPAEQRLADAQAHIEREKGEVKGQSKPGTTFDVIRSVIRRYAIRDPEAASALADKFDEKCVPPWGPRMARHVWNAYNRATEPSWGYAYRGVAERLSLPPVPDSVIVSHLKSIKAKRPSEPQKILEKDIVVRVLDGQYLGVDEPLAAEVLARVCPAGTTDAQLVQILLNTHMSDQRAEELVRTVRMAHAAKLPRLDEMIPDVVIDGVNLGQPIFDGEAVNELVEDSPDVLLLRKLRLDDDGVYPRNCSHNMNMIFCEDSVLKGHVRFNLVTKKVEITVPPFDKTDPNTLVRQVKIYLDSKWHIDASPTDIRDQLLFTARQNDYNPVRQFLVTPTWDLTRRIDTWLIDYCGADDTEFNRRVGAMWLIAACARGMVPGSKVDNVLILEGRQGTKKSSTFKVLGNSWYSGSPISINTKDGQQMMSFCWIVELAELASLRVSETEAQKQFLTVDHDVFRPPYGSAPEKFPRFAVCGGTTNDEEYLPDIENRRYWPVKIRTCNTVKLAADCNQLWAEALHRYLSSDLNPHLAHELCPGERWWFETEEEQEMAASVVVTRRPENTWASLIRDWAGMKLMGGGPAGKRQWTLAEIAEGALGIDADKLGSKQKQITAAVRESGLSQVKGDGGRRMWRAPDSMIAQATGAAVAQDPAAAPN